MEPQAVQRGLDKLRKSNPDLAKRANLAVNTNANDIIANSSRISPPSRVDPVDPITPEDISGAATPADVDVDTTSTAGSGLLAQLEAQAEQYTQNLEKEEQAAATRADTSFQEYLKSITQAPTEGEITQEVFEEQGVDEKQAEVNRLNDQLRREQMALRRQVEDIQTGAGTATKAQRDLAAQEAERVSLRKQADIAVVQLAAQDQFEAAEATANRAVEAQMQRQEKVTEALGALYARNQNLFTTAEQRAFEAKQADRQRALDAEENRLKDIKNIGLMYLQEGGSPQVAQQIMESEDIGTAYALTEGLLGETARLQRNNLRIQNALNQEKYDQLIKEIENPDVLDPETREKIGKFEPAQQAVAQAQLSKNMDDLLSLIKTHGTKNITDPVAAGKINSLRAQLEIDIAVAGGQGAISGDEADRYGNIVGSGWTDRSKKVESSLKQAISVQNKKAKTNIELTSSTFPGATQFEPFVEFLDEYEENQYLDDQLGVETPQQEKSNAITNWLKNTAVEIGTRAITPGM